MIQTMGSPLFRHAISKVTQVNEGFESKPPETEDQGELDSLDQSMSQLLLRRSASRRRSSANYRASIATLSSGPDTETIAEEASSSPSLTSKLSWRDVRDGGENLFSLLDQILSEGDDEEDSNFESDSLTQVLSPKHPSSSARLLPF